MASFHVMCGYFRANAVLTAEIEQLESYIEGLQRLSWLNLSVDTLVRHYRVRINRKQNQIEANKLAASEIVANSIRS